MKAYITSIGEETTDLCEWALKRNGFDVQLVYNETTTLAEKLEYIYGIADEDFVRVDADVIVNRLCRPELISQATLAHPDAWWIQFRSWCWYSQGLIYGGVQFIKKEALPALRANIGHFKDISRPETEISRIKEFYEPRRFESHDVPMGIHGYGIKNLKPIIKLKAARGQSGNYDFELAQRLNEL